MAVLYSILVVVHIVACAALVIVVLLQSSKGGGLAGAFGGGALSGAAFGGRGAATFLSKATSVVGTAFLVTSLTLALISLGIRGLSGESGVADDLMKGPEQTMPPASSAVPGETEPGEASSLHETSRRLRPWRP